VWVGVSVWWGVGRRMVRDTAYRVGGQKKHPEEGAPPVVLAGAPC
jgi:hypothetical protein